MSDDHNAVPTQTRRTLLKYVGVVGSSLAVGSRPGVTTGASTDRFLIDLQEVSRGAIPSDVDIVHDLSAIDVLAAWGDPDYSLSWRRKRSCRQSAAGWEISSETGTVERAALTVVYCCW